MKRLFTTCIALFLALCLHEANAQIGINTMDPDTNAVLDIQSKDKGIKLPSIPNTAVLKAPNDQSGYLIYQTTDKKFRYWNTKIWESVNPFSADETNENITAPKNLNVTATVTANNFVGYGTIPMGGIIMWSGTENNIPDGWALCDGTNGTPNLSGRFIAGYSNNPEYAIGFHNNGKDYLTLTNDNLPTHSHEVGSLAISEAGIHAHLVSSDGNRGPGGGGREPINYKTGVTQTVTNSTGSHTHEITGSTHNTGGIYTYETYANPPLLNQVEKCFPYSMQLYGTTYYLSNNYIKNFSTNSEYTFYAEKDGSYHGPYYRFNVYSRHISTGATYSIGLSFISDCPDGNFAIDGPILVDNNSYDGSPYINPLHIPGKPLNATIVHNEKWNPQPFDNRPPYYVLAFIMRIK